MLRPRYSSYVMVWESSTNRAGLVDVDTGTVRRGVELLPLRNKIFSGWYDRVAIRRLTGLTDEQRDRLYETMLKVSYSSNNIVIYIFIRYVRSFKEDHMKRTS